MVRGGEAEWLAGNEDGMGNSSETKHGKTFPYSLGRYPPACGRQPLRVVRYLNASAKNDPASNQFKDKFNEKHHWIARVVGHGFLLFTPQPLSGAVKRWAGCNK